MESHSGQKWLRLFLRSSFSDNKPRSRSIKRDANPPFENWYWSFEICSHGFFWPVEKFFHRLRFFYRSRIFFHLSRIFYRLRIFLASREFFLPVENFLCQSRIFLLVKKHIWSVEKFFTGRDFFVTDREIFLSVENFFTDQEVLFGQSRIFWVKSRIPFSVENSLVSGLYESNFVTWLNKKNGGHCGCPGLYGTLATDTI